LPVGQTFPQPPQLPLSTALLTQAAPQQIEFASLALPQ
jgi:hypothetical protein